MEIFTSKIVVRQFFKSFYYLLDFFVFVLKRYVFMWFLFFLYCRRRISNVVGVYRLVFLRDVDPTRWALSHVVAD